MAAYDIPTLAKPPKAGKKQILLVTSGDLRLSANQVCWEAQKQMEEVLGKAVADAGFELVRAHPYKPKEKHGFISSQKEGMEVLGVTSYGDLSQFAQQQSRASAFILSIDRLVRKESFRDISV